MGFRAHLLAVAAGRLAIHARHALDLALASASGQQRAAYCQTARTGAG
jgi:hypothetical protein